MDWWGHFITEPKRQWIFLSDKGPFSGLPFSMEKEDVAQAPRAGQGVVVGGVEVVAALFQLVAQGLTRPS